MLAQQKSHGVWRLSGRISSLFATHLLIEILVPRQVGDRRIDATAEILKNHGGRSIAATCIGSEVVRSDDALLWWPSRLWTCGGGAVAGGLSAKASIFSRRANGYPRAGRRFAGRLTEV